MLVQKELIGHIRINQDCITEIGYVDGTDDDDRLCYLHPETRIIKE